MKKHKQFKHEGIRYPCDLCDFSAGTLGILRRHKESRHYGIKYPCGECEYIAPTSVTLRRHVKQVHEGVRYPCDVCDFVANRTGQLKRHKLSKHEGVRYHCDQCTYAASTVCDLKRHTKSKHDGVRYPCDACEATFTDSGNLKRHKKTKHGIMSYLCDQCDYFAAEVGLLKGHMKSVHDVCMPTSSPTPIIRPQAPERISEDKSSIKMANNKNFDNSAAVSKNLASTQKFVASNFKVYNGKMEENEFNAFSFATQKYSSTSFESLDRHIDDKKSSGTSGELLHRKVDNKEFSAASSTMQSSLDNSAAKETTKVSSVSNHRSTDTKISDNDDFDQLQPGQEQEDLNASDSPESLKVKSEDNEDNPEDIEDKSEDIEEDALNTILPGINL